MDQLNQLTIQIERLQRLDTRSVQVKVSLDLQSVQDKVSLDLPSVQVKAN